jgi:hypothetical protein
VNSLEERARAAVRATASEIGPHDVPPMRPIGSGADGGLGAGTRRGRGGGGGAWGGGRHAAWRWGAPLAAAAAVVAVIAAAGLLGGVSPSPASRPVATKPVLHPVAEPAAAQPPHLPTGLVGLFLPASGAQYSAGALFMGEFRALEGKISSECMVRLGFPAQPVATPAEIARGFWDLSQFPDLGAIARAGTLPSYSIGPAPPESKAHQQAFAHCQTVGMNPFEPMLRAGRTLGDPFITTISQIQASAPVTATLPALRACAAKYGWPNDPYGPPRPINSFGDFVDWVAGHIDGAGSRGASASEMNALDRHWGHGIRAMRAADRRRHGAAAARGADEVPGRAPSPVPGAGQGQPRGFRPRKAPCGQLATGGEKAEGLELVAAEGFG